MSRWSGIFILILLLQPYTFVAAQKVEHNPSEQTWTLESGPVMYRFAMDYGQVVFEYFGPRSHYTGRGSHRPQRRYDIMGMVDGRVLDPSRLRLAAHESRVAAPDRAELHMTFTHMDVPLEVEALYTAWGETGVITRALTFANRGTKPIRVESAPSLSMDLPRGEYTLRYLWGGWGQERQLATERLDGAGARRFEQTQGRSTKHYVPWLSLRNEDTGVEYLAELAWSGNWWMEVERQLDEGRGRLEEWEVSVAMGLRNDFGGPIVLSPGETFALPLVAMTASSGDLDDAANQMHRYQRAYIVPVAPANRPLLVQFNTWYPLGPNVNIENTKRAVDAAAEIGAEAYVLDSGWYSSGDWSRTLGDYEVDRTKFPNGLEELARYVRQKGMIFGLWVEIENVGTESRLFREHPEWCLSYEGEPIITGDRCQLDFAIPEVRQWASATIDRLVRTLDLGWIKIDYNIDIGDHFDPAQPGKVGRRLYDHIHSYYAWLDEIRAAHPDLIIENCASGGLRFDTGIMAHAHTTWISDEIVPHASLQLRYGCTVQFAPEVCNHWIVGHNHSGEIDLTSPPGWWDFMFGVAMNGQFGISSRIWEWSPEQRDRAAANVARYKRIRNTITGADVYHLTPAPDTNDPTDWMAIQYVADGRDRSVLMVYRLPGGGAERTFRLRGLLPDAVYAVYKDGEVVRQATGGELASSGFSVMLDEEWRAAVFEIEQQPL